MHGILTPEEMNWLAGKVRTNAAKKQPAPSGSAECGPGELDLPVCRPQVFTEEDLLAEFGLTPQDLAWWGEQAIEARQNRRV